jgi:hypothetical protein
MINPSTTRIPKVDPSSQSATGSSGDDSRRRAWETIERTKRTGFRLTKVYGSFQDGRKLMNGRSRGVERSLVLPIHGISFVGLAVVTSYFAYLWGSTSPNPAELLAPTLFWYAVAFLLFAYPLREALRIFLRNIGTAFGAGVFTLYLILHVLLYGFMLESILVSFFDRPFVSASTSVYVTTSVFAPSTLLNAIVGLWFNPWITLTFPPLFSDALSLYSVVIALVIAILIVANIGKTRELGKICSTRLKSRTMVLFPALGIALGASCCLSVPILFSVVVPSAVVLSSSLWVYDATYFLFPPFAVILLYLNLYSVNRIATRVGQQGAS